MKVLRDIKCISAPFGDEYTDDGLNGRIIVEDNNAKGLLFDETKSYLVFGNVSDDYIKLYVCSNHDKELPKLYEGILDNKKYSGTKYVVNRYDKFPIEECQIGVYNPDYYRDVTDEEIDNLEKIFNLRIKALGNESRIIYDNENHTVSKTM